MKKDEFMKELDYLLQDIPDEDKADALAYYRDYLEEAGPENEEKALRDFGSPERIASIIRSDLSGELEDGGSFTENGYEDERFRDPNYQLMERLETPAGREAGEGPFTQGPVQKGGRPAERPRWKWWQIAGMILIVCCAVPMALPLVFGIGGGAIGLLFGGLSFFGGLLVCVTIALAAVTIALLLAGILLIILGIVQMTFPAQGILYLGTGIGVLGLGLLCLALCGLYYGRFLPWLGGTIINLVSRILHRKERKRETVY